MYFGSVVSSYGSNSNIGSSTKLSAHIFVLLVIGIAASMDIPPGTSFQRLKCSFADKVYDANQTWYKHLKNPKSEVCIQCTCKAGTFGGSATCSNITCNQNLCTGTNRHDCCSECHDSLSMISDGPKLPCLHAGKVYQEGEEFSSNTTGIEAQKPNQCIHCKCKFGLVLCRLKTCDQLHCFSAEENGCCATCTDEIAPREQASQPNPILVTITVATSQSHNGDCIAAGITYSHGSTWHPVIGPFGPMDCVYCKCQNGKIECSRLSCQQKLPCSKPIQVPGHCCPQCTDEKLENDQPSLTTPVERTANQQPKVVPTEVYCLPAHTNTVVFRSHASSSNSAYYQYAFQPLDREDSTRLLTWTIKGGRLGDYSEQYLSTEEFQSLMSTFQFKLQGATRTKFMDKFIRKAKRLPDRCGGRCTTKVEQLVHVLHLKETYRRQSCLAHETPFYR